MESRAALHAFLSPTGVEGAYKCHSEASKAASTSSPSIPTPNSFVGFGFGTAAQSGWARQDAPRWSTVRGAGPQPLPTSRSEPPSVRASQSPYSQPQSQWTVLDELEAGHITNR